MRCVAVIEASRPGLDSVLLWEDTGRLVAFAYQDGKVTMTRPLAASTLDDAINEVLDNFQITTGQATRITNWTDTAVQAGPVGPVPTRWGPS